MGRVRNWVVCCGGMLENGEKSGCNARMKVLCFVRMKGWEVKVWKLRFVV